MSDEATPEEPVVEPAEAPAEEPAEAPVEEPAEAPAEEPIEAAMPAPIAPEAPAESTEPEETPGDTAPADTAPEESPAEPVGVPDDSAPADAVEAAIPVVSEDAAPIPAVEEPAPAASEASAVEADETTAPAAEAHEDTSSDDMASTSSGDRGDEATTDAPSGDPEDDEGHRKDDRTGGKGDRKDDRTGGKGDGKDDRKGGKGDHKGDRKGGKGGKGDRRREGGGKRGGRDNELFKDLEDRPADDIKRDLERLRNDLRVHEQELNSLADSRRTAIDEVKLLREASRASAGVGEEQRALVTQLRAAQKEADALRKQRDAVNKRVPLYLPTIEHQLQQTAIKLFRVSDNPLRQPRHGDEISLFSRFFELQAMHAAKIAGDALHEQVKAASTGMRDLIKQLDELRSKRAEVAEKVLEEAPHLDTDKVDRKQIRKLSKRIDAMKERLDGLYDGRREMRREIGRLDAWLRIIEKRGRGGGGGGGGPRGARGGPGHVSADSVRAKAAAGGRLDLAELQVLLEAGGLGDAVQPAAPKPAAEPTPKQRMAQRTRNIGPARGRRRVGRHEGGRDQRR